MCWSLTLHWPVFRIPAYVDIQIGKPTLVEFHLFVLCRRAKMNSVCVCFFKYTHFNFDICVQQHGVLGGQYHVNKVLNSWGPELSLSVQMIQL